MSYQKITDLFIATSTDYNPKSEEAYTFFKLVQNKLHYAISGQTAAELIYSRANHQKEHMGLTNWKNSPNGKILKTDVVIAKNYLSKEELEQLELIVTAFLDLAEARAKRHIPMTKVLTEFEKYRVKQDKLYKSDFDLLLEEIDK